ncbi:hypothetical protein CsSME_00014092 [Camellia sinensis var. sinensis]
MKHRHGKISAVAVSDTGTSQGHVGDTYGTRDTRVQIWTRRETRQVGRDKGESVKEESEERQTYRRSKLHESSRRSKLQAPSVNRTPQTIAIDLHP